MKNIFKQKSKNKGRALKVHRLCNQVLFNAESEQQLLDEVCYVIVDDGGYRLAWVGYPEEDEYKSIKPVAYCGYEAGYLESLKLTWDDTERGHGPAGTCVRTGESHVVRDVHEDPGFVPWREAALERGYSSVASFPLNLDKNKPGVILIYAKEADAFDKDEIELFHNLSESLAYGINGIRAREEHKLAKEKTIESETKFRNLVEGSLQGIFVHREFKPLFANQKCADIFGFKNPEEILELDSILEVFWTAEERERIRAYNRRRMTGGEAPAFYECRAKHMDGPLLWLENRVTTIDWQGEKAIQASLINITERKQAEQELQIFMRALEASPSAVIITDADRKIEYVNPRFSDITGYTKEEVMAQVPRLLLQSEETTDSVYDDISASMKLKGEWKGEFHSKKKDGSLYWERVSISCVRNVTGKISHYIGIQDDVTHEYELNEQLGYQASHDALTGLINRREFERRVKRLITTIHQGNDEHALCYMDLDQFKIVNDTCGHTAGDEMLRQISMVLQHEVRKRDTLARLGGDEFGVLMEHCSLGHANRVARSILKAIQDFQFAWEGHSFRVGVSIGLVAINKTTPNLTELLKEADAACYMAKDKGRNRIHLYHTEDVELSKRHGEMQWVTRIQQALEKDRFCLYAQTIVPLDNSTNKHYELLIRMIDDKGTLIPPNAFLPAAERYNLITQLDRWVIKKAFVLLAENPVFLNQIHFISINLSGPSLADESFLGFVIKYLHDSGIEGEKICFEITETAAISNMSSAIKFITTLKELGCYFSLDDFGSGLSSFAYLKNLPVDFLKIDGMFVKDIVDDPIDRAMVKSINEIGKVMGMQTIAEFVENDIIKGILNEIGVNYAQGYGIEKPMPFDELLGRSNNVSNINKSKNGN